MTTHSIRVPDAWLIQTAHGRYEETEFEFRLESTESTNLYVRLVGHPISKYEAVYTIEAVIDDGEEQSVIVDECITEREAMETTEEQLHHLQQSSRDKGRTLNKLDAETPKRSLVGFDTEHFDTEFERSLIRYRTHRLLTEPQV